MKNYPIMLIMALLVLVNTQAQEIIENPESPQNSNAGRVRKVEEIFRITDESGEFYFRYPYLIKVASDDSIFMKDSNQLLRFDKKGQFLRNYFVKGQGPVEFNSINNYHLFKDRLIIYDGTTKRITWLNFDGDLIKDFKIDLEVRLQDFLFFNNNTYYFLSRDHIIREEKPQIVDWPHRLLAVTQEGKEIDELTVFPVKMYMLSSQYRVIWNPISQFVRIPFSEKYLMEKKPFIKELVLLSKFGGLDVPREQILANPSDLAVSEGFIYILDSRDNNIKVFKKEGTFIKSYGQQGQGPGEFRRPWTLSFVQDKIYVTDTGNRRVQVLSKEGDFLRSYRVAVEYGSGMSFDKNGNLCVNTKGFRSPKLIAVYDNQGDLITEFGDLEGNSIKYYDFILIKKQIKEGKIPDSFKNDVLLIPDNRGNFFAVHRAINKIKKFSSTGKLLKETEIRVDEFKDIYKEFLRKNEGETSQSIYWPLIYINDLAIDKLGNLYLLLNMPEQMIVYAFSNNCEFLGKLLGVEDSISRIDIPNDNIMFALSQETQFVYEFSLNIN